MATYDFIHVKCPEQGNSETGSRLEFGVKKREALGRGMGFHFEEKKMFKNCLVMVAYV